MRAALHLCQEAYDMSVMYLLIVSMLQGALVFLLVPRILWLSLMFNEALDILEYFYIRAMPFYFICDPAILCVKLLKYMMWCREVFLCTVACGSTMYVHKICSTLHCLEPQSLKQVVRTWELLHSFFLHYNGQNGMFNTVTCFCYVNMFFFIQPGCSGITCSCVLWHIAKL